jgi:UTP--glucose-1-phosphate uridylyltransferase
MPSISLDSRHYKKIDAFLARFPKNPISLLKCDSLVVEGDVLFEQDVQCVGDVRIVNPGPNQAVIKAGSVLQGEVLVA